jgi:hypothetical protein
MRRPIRHATLTWIVAALVLVSCGPQAGIVLGGFGSGPSASFAEADGVYHIHWTAHDAGATDHGCLVGLSVEQIRAANQEHVIEFRAVTESKLVYRSIPVGARLVGDAAIYLDAGTYLLRSNGTCAWDAQILPAGPDEIPLNGNPRMETVG